MNDIQRSIAQGIWSAKHWNPKKVRARLNKMIEVEKEKRRNK